METDLGREGLLHIVLGKTLSLAFFLKEEKTDNSLRCGAVNMQIAGAFFPSETGKSFQLPEKV